MRTTVDIDEAVLRRLKAEAARSGRTIGALVEDAVRALFDAPSRQAGELEPLVTAGGSGVMPGVDITDLRSVREAMDDGESLDALR